MALTRQDVLIFVLYCVVLLKWIDGPTETSHVPVRTELRIRPSPATTVPPPASSRKIILASAVPDVTAAAVSKTWEERYQRSITFKTNASNPDLMPPFKFMLPADDADAEQPLQQGVLEPFITHKLFKHIASCCAAGGHFTDVGGNYGWFAMQAAAMGCSVDSFEPMRHYSMLMEYNLFTLNKFDRSKVRVHKNMIVGNVLGQKVTMQHRNMKSMGMVAVNFGGEVSSDDATTVTLDSMLDKLVQPGRRECGLKVDVEGYEPFVFLGAKQFLDITRPQAVIIENSPAMTKDYAPGGTEEAGMALLGHMLDDLVNARGYDTNRFNWGIIKKPDMKYHQENTLHGLREDMRFVPHNMTRYAACGYNCMVYLSSDGFEG